MPRCSCRSVRCFAASRFAACRSYVRRWTLAAAAALQPCRAAAMNGDTRQGAPAARGAVPAGRIAHLRRTCSSVAAAHASRRLVARCASLRVTRLLFAQPQPASAPPTRRATVVIAYTRTYFAAACSRAALRSYATSPKGERACNAAASATAHYQPSAAHARRCARAAAPSSFQFCSALVLFSGTHSSFSSFELWYRRVA